MASQHNPDSCPELFRKEAALQQARNVLAVVQQVALDQRGVAGCVNDRAEDLPSSAGLMAGQDSGRTSIFNDELTARKYREVLLPSAAQQDGTIPQTADQKRAHVNVLFRAFKSVPRDSGEGDKIKEKFVNEEHDNALVEAVCWELLEDCIRRAKTPVHLTEAYEPGKAKGKTDDWTFADRFDHLVQALAESKSICKHLFDVPFRVKLVDDPLRSSKRVASNRALNLKKAEALKRGREAAKEDEKEAKRLKREVATAAQVDNNLAGQGHQQQHQQQLQQPILSQYPPATGYPVPSSLSGPADPSRASYPMQTRSAYGGNDNMPAFFAGGGYQAMPYGGPFAAPGQQQATYNSYPPYNANMPVTPTQQPRFRRPEQQDARQGLGAASRRPATHSAIQDHGGASYAEQFGGSESLMDPNLNYQPVEPAPWANQPPIQQAYGQGAYGRQQPYAASPQPSHLALTGSTQSANSSDHEAN
ncbi:hypothetical protein ABEF92_008161 [Exophiala dermatitidis]|uniref:Uncharacterized protein n=1 Tax=Exophiala dermatitidis (strain ATCC 34100 / CBS 525.76 / NIH/UT8656) TaxID=858893 RepID=H6BS29_EXODN|nr:uncharacterized protein HMPREF1120_02261 [Exophiala dermatitidis NIH/UT8656]XP_009154546.1 hypothetical protein, variant [Exophiala dermatitidis NIH/UT8656]EHY54084.1 hypothetical protein, variant [Exophiala dermatitidis NIH/UT8656]EHY54085.1 hypothetical protein HMPREF1120_02261 [Exophiala dermatitidis NIH/UT8656]